MPSAAETIYWHWEYHPKRPLKLLATIEKDGRVIEHEPPTSADDKALRDEMIRKAQLRMPVAS